MRLASPPVSAGPEPIRGMVGVRLRRSTPARSAILSPGVGKAGIVSIYGVNY